MGLLTRMRAQTELILLSKGQFIKEVCIPEIPKDWDFFLGTKDKWIEVVFPDSENSTNAIYEGEQGSLFPPHVHLYSDEMITILNKEGECKVITDKEVKIIKYGESFVFPHGTPHAVVFNKKTKLFVHWHPHFKKGWDAKFTD